MPHFRNRRDKFASQWAYGGYREIQASRCVAVAVGSLAFVEKVKRELGVKAMHRAATEADWTFTLREPREAYTSVVAGKNDVLRLDNSRFYEGKSAIQGSRVEDWRGVS